MAQGASSDNFLQLVEWIDKQVAKAVLGQTATTEGTPGRLGSDDAQAEVRQDLIAADAKQLADTLNRDLVKSVIDINYGAQQAYPRIVITLPEQEDLALLASNVEKMVNLNMEVSMQEVRQKMGLSTPGKDEQLLRAPNMPSFEQAHNQQLAMNRDAGGLTDLLLDDLQPITQDLLRPLHTQVDSAKSFDELIAQLPEVLKSMDTETLQDILSRAGFTASAQGAEDK